MNCAICFKEVKTRTSLKIYDAILCEEPKCTIAFARQQATQVRRLRGENAALQNVLNRVKSRLEGYAAAKQEQCDAA